jgi:hypothetical protein
LQQRPHCKWHQKHAPNREEIGEVVPHKITAAQ